MIAPEVIRLAEGVTIIDQVINQPGVETLEGKIGPLLKGVHNQVHYLELPPGLYTEEHPHPTESLIYTVSGRWVLCSAGNRHVMNPGSVFWFGPDVPTGYEVPFDNPAFILAFKEKSSGDWDEFVDYLRNHMQPWCIEEHEKGVPFFLKELSDDHPARVFARQVHPTGSW